MRRHSFGFVALLAALLASSLAWAQDVDVQANATWGDNRTYDSVTVHNGVILTLSNNAVLTVGEMLVRAGGRVRFVGTNRIEATDLHVEAGGTIEADGRGSGQEAGAGAGRRSNEGGSGGSHGGQGGAGHNQGFRPPYYGSALLPRTKGSGGGRGNRGSAGGGNGGGLVDLRVTGTFTHFGLVSANGNGSACSNSRSGGGGSGGSIFVDGGVLTGTGYFRANGGNSCGTRYRGGGGGGGRIAVYYDSMEGGFNPLSSQVNGGTGHAGGARGTLGFFAKDPAGGPPSLLAVSSWRFETGDTQDNRFDFTNLNLHNVTATGPYGNYEVRVAAHTNLVGSANWMCNTNGVTLRTDSLRVGASSRIYARGRTARLIVAADALLEGGYVDASTIDSDVAGTLAMTAASYYAATTIDIDGGNLNMAAGTLLNTDARGSGPEAGDAPGRRSNEGGSGGGNGGAGGAGYNQGTPGTFVGSALRPVRHGSGGGHGNRGSARGGNGGGLIRVDLNGTFTLEGLVTANGATGARTNQRGGGGGAGGSIYVVVDRVEGGGYFRSNGGAGGPDRYSGGGGGGGRIAVWANELGLGDRGRSTVNAGGGHRGGEIGTLVFVRRGDPADLHIHHGWRWENTDTVDGAPFEFGNVTVYDGAVRGPLDGRHIDLSGHLDVRASVQWNMTFSNFTAHVLNATLANGVYLNNSGRRFVLEAGERLQLDGNARVLANRIDTTADELVLNNSSRMQAQRIYVTAGDMSVAQAAFLDTNGRGHGQQGGSGAGHQSNEGGSGAAHGGAAGQGYNQGSRRGFYGRALTPSDLGSGGGRGDRGSVAGGAGGGAIRVQVARGLTLDGQLRSNGSGGARGNQRGGGGGAGGSVWVTTDSVLGAGLMSANGGNGGADRYSGGGGSGGRIALHCNECNLDAPQSSTVNGGTGYRNAEKGTYAIVDTDDNKLSAYHGWRWEAAENPFEWDDLFIYASSHVRGVGSATNLTVTNLSELQGSITWNQNSGALNWHTGELSIAGGTNVQGGGTVNLALDVFGELSGSGRVTSTSRLTVVGPGDLTFNNSARFIAPNVVLNELGDVVLNDSAYLQGNISGTVANLQVAAAAYLSANGYGYGPEAGSGPGRRSNEGGSGGGHGGHGGDGYNQGGEGAYYGVALEPTLKGSGGGHGNRGSGAGGGKGGGVVDLRVHGSFVHDGIVRANGNGGARANQRGGGGGAGGSVRIKTTALSGNGRFQAIGAAGGADRYSGGGGGGGRIAVYSDERTLVAPENSSVAGGAGHRGGQAGTLVFVDYGADRDVRDDDHLDIYQSYRWENGDPAFAYRSMHMHSGASVRGPKTADRPIVLSHSMVLDSGVVWNMNWVNTAIAMSTGLLQGSARIEGTSRQLRLEVSEALTLRNSSRLRAAYIQLRGTAALSLEDSAYFNASDINLVMDELAVAPSAYLSTNSWGHGRQGGPGAGHQSNEGGSGGSHGGLGGQGYNQGSRRTFYASAFRPRDKGSGGGNGDRGARHGGAGGGRIRAVVAGTTLLDGVLYSNGANGAVGNQRGGGGGAGGSIWLSTHALSGSGRFEARGGNGGADRYSGGGGGGGRVFVDFDQSSLAAPQASLVSGGSGYRGGEVGTLAFYDRDDLDLLMVHGWRWEDGDAPFALNVLRSHSSTLVRSTGTALTIDVANLVDLGASTTWNNSPTNLTMAMREFRSNNLSMSGRTVTFDCSEDFSMRGGRSIAVSTMRMRGRADVSLSDSAYIRAGTIDFTHGGTVRLSGSSKLQGNISGLVDNLSIAAAARLDANGYGYAREAGTGPGRRSNEGGSGGSHGGYGGAGYNQGGRAAFYGSARLPATKGSGGGNGDRGSVHGGAGGGLIRMTVLGGVTVDGTIRANGNNGARGNQRGGGGGAGGGIQMHCSLLAGRGTFQANGGAGGADRYSGGGGAGGRILVYYDESALDAPASSTVSGGAGQQGGEAGTLAFMDRDDSHLHIYQRWRWEDADAPFEYQRLTLHSGSRSYGTGRALAVLVGDRTSVQNNARWYSTAANLDLETTNLEMSGSARFDTGSRAFNLLATGEVSLRDSAYVTSRYLTVHGLPDTKLRGSSSLRSNLMLSARDLLIEPSAYINASGRGHGQEGGSGAGHRSNEGGSGASHGGRGGAGYNQGSRRNPYGNPDDPRDTGSGGRRGHRGSVGGGAGGGIIRVEVIGSMEHSGSIRASGNNGARGNQRGGGGGSGGSIYIGAASLSGNGRVEAKGGNGGADRYSGGGGGGGRVATCVGANGFAGNVDVRGGSGYRGGGGGTTFNNCDFPTPPTFLLLSQGPVPPRNMVERREALGLVMMQLSLREFTGNAARLAAINFTGVGSGDDAASVAAVRLYLDADSDGEVDPEDPQLGDPAQYAGNDGQVRFEPDLEIDGFGSADLLVVYDLTDVGAAGHTFAVRMAQNNHLEVRAEDDTLGGVAGAPLQGATLTIHVDPPPRVGGTSPSTVRSSHSSDVTVYGRYFTGADRVRLTDPLATELEILQVVSDTRVLARVPANISPGRYHVRVRTEHGENANSSRLLTVDASCVTGLPGVCRPGRWLGGACQPLNDPREEVCSNNVDEDCDGRDLDCRDVDGDGDGVTPREGDCDDTDPNVHPGGEGGNSCSSEVVTYGPERGLIQGTPNDAIIYDAATDEDPDTAWRDNTDASWYQEALATLRDSAAQIFGPGDRVVLAADPNLEPEGELTFEAWVRLDELPAGDTNIFGSPGAWGFEIVNGRLRCRCGPPAEPGGEPSVLELDDETLEPGVWYHLAGSYNGLTYRFFVNGTPRAEDFVDGTWEYAGLGATVGPLNGQSMRGRIDEVRLYTRPLTEQEAMRSYRLGVMHQASDVDEEGLVLWLPFDTSPRDESGYGLHGVWEGDARITGRSSQPWFPDECHIVATDEGLDLIDGRTERLWMRIFVNADCLLQDGVERVVMQGGRLYTGSSDQGSGLWIIDFRYEECTHTTTAGTFRYAGGLAARNEASGYEQHSDVALPDNRIYDLAAGRSGGRTRLAMGLGRALALYDPHAAEPRMVQYTDGNPEMVFRAVAYANDTLYFSTMHQDDLRQNRLGAIYSASALNQLSPMDAPFYRSPAPGGVPGGAMELGGPGAIIYDIDIWPGGSESNPGDNVIYAATSEGAAVIHEHQGDEIAGYIIYILCTCGEHDDDRYYVLWGEVSDTRAISAFPFMVGTQGAGVSVLDNGFEDPADWLREYWTGDTALALPSDNVTSISASADLLIATDEGVAVVRYPDGPECLIPGLHGECAKGVTREVRGREICLRRNRPTNETCDNLDNDCDGRTDNAANGRNICGSAAPFINAGRDVTVRQEGCDAAQVQLLPPDVADDVDPFPFVQCDTPAVYPLGATVVTCTATDLDGNSASDSVVVTVAKTGSPQVIPADDPDPTEATSPAGTAVQIGEPRVSDCDPATAVTSDAPALYPVGSTVVTWTATDSFGNQGTATQTVVVVDTTPPVVTAAGDISVVDEEGDGVPLEDLDLPLPEVADAGDGDVDVVHDAPDVFEFGETVVTFTATDASGNAASDTLVVTVDLPEGAPYTEMTASPEGFGQGPMELAFELSGGCNGAPTVEVDPLDGPLERAGNDFTTSYSGEGIWHVEVRASDGCGFVTRRRFHFAVDLTPPAYEALIPDQQGVDPDDPFTLPIYLQGERIPLAVRASDAGIAPSGVADVTLDVLMGEGEEQAPRVIGRHMPDPVGGEPLAWPDRVKAVGCTEPGDLCTEDEELDLTQVPLGPNRVRVQVTDAAGNLTEGDLHFTHLDLVGVIERVLYELDELYPDANGQGQRYLDDAIALLQRALAGAQVDQLGSVLISFEPALKKMRRAEGEGVDCLYWQQLLTRAAYGAVTVLLDQTRARVGNQHTDIQLLARYYDDNYPAQYQQELYSGCALALANTYFHLIHAVRPHDVRSFAATTPVLGQIMDEMEEYVALPQAPGEDLIRIALPVLEDTHARVGAWARGELASYDYVQMLYDFQDVSNTIIAAEDDGCWIRNWAFGLMKVLRYLIQDSMNYAVEVVGEDDVDIQEAQGLWVLGQTWIEDREVDFFIDRYGDDDITCLIARIHNKGWDPDVLMPAHCPQQDEPIED